MQLQSDAPLEFESLFAQQMQQAADQPEMNIAAPTFLDTAFDQQFGFLELPIPGGQTDMTDASQISDAMAQNFFSGDAQAQLPSISEVMTATATVANQPEPANSTVTAQTPTGKKKTQPRKKKTPVKEKTPSKEKAPAKKRVTAKEKAAAAKAMQNPGQVQQQTTEPSFGLDQVMASDPFVCSATSQQSPNNGQNMFNLGMSAMGQTQGHAGTSMPQTNQMNDMSQMSGMNQMFGMGQMSNMNQVSDMNQMDGMNQMSSMDYISGMDDMFSGNVNITAQQTTQTPTAIQQAFTATGPIANHQAVMSTKEQTSPGVPQPATQKLTQSPLKLAMFMKHQSQPSTPGSLREMRSPSSAHTSTQARATPASENKRKASINQGMETPTKRRQSVNQQGTVVHIAQPLPVPAIPQGLQSPAQNNQMPTQSNETPAQNNQTSAQNNQMSVQKNETSAQSDQMPAQALQTPQQIPIDPALHFNISPPSGGMRFGTAIKAGICTAIAHIVKEASTGSIFAQPLLDGPIEDFRSELGSHIKQVIKTHVVAVNATNPQDDQQAFLKGAFKLLQGILQEIERRGCAFKKALLSGPVSGPDLIPARRGMATVYQAIMAEYTSPPRFDGGFAQPAKLQDTPTREPTAHIRVSSQSSNMANGFPSTGSPRLQGCATSPGTPAQCGMSSPQMQMNGHAASSSPMQPFPTLPVESSGYPSPMNHNYPTPPSPMNGYTTIPAGYPQQAPATQASDTAMTGVPEPTNYYPTPAGQAQQPQKQQQQQGEEQQKPKPKRARKSRARKPSAAATPQPEASHNTGTPGSNPATPVAQDSNSMAQGTTTTTGESTTPLSSTTKQCIPRLYYQFTDGAFYMELHNERGEETHHRMGRGTTAAETALGAFVEAARAEGIATCPVGFVFRLWRGVVGNVEDLKAAILEAAAAGYGGEAGVGLEVGERVVVVAQEGV
jgi:hypothetical protein